METENNLSAWDLKHLRWFEDSFISKCQDDFFDTEDCPPEYIEAVNDNFEDLI